MSDMKFRNKLDLELKNIVFTDKSRDNVLERAASLNRAAGRVSAAGYISAAGLERKLSVKEVWRERLYSFMNMELRVPVKPLVVALLITVSGIVYACVGITRVSDEDIRRSSITVVDSNMGGQTDGIYKDKG